MEVQTAGPDALLRRVTAGAARGRAGRCSRRARAARAGVQLPANQALWAPVLARVPATNLADRSGRGRGTSADIRLRP